MGHQNLETIFFAVINNTKSTTTKKDSKKMRGLLTRRQLKAPITNQLKATKMRMNTPKKMNLQHMPLHRDHLRMILRRCLNLLALMTICLPERPYTHQYLRFKYSLLRLC